MTLQPLRQPISSSSSSSPDQGANNQLFHAELPSECNLYSSSKRCTQPPPLIVGGSVGSVPIITKFATEHHSVTLTQNNTKLVREPDGGCYYSLSSTRLPQLKSTTRKAAAKKNNFIAAEPESSADACLAHSSIVLGNTEPHSSPLLSAEVFAMMRTTTTAAENNRQVVRSSSSIKDPSSSMDKSTSPANRRQPSSNESATSRDDAKPGGDLVSSGRRTISTDASVATMISAASTRKNDMITGGGEDDTTIDATSVKFYLLVKMIKGGGRVSSGGFVSEHEVHSSQPTTTTIASSSRTSFKECIALDFRPMVVHAAEIHVDTTATTTTSDDDDDDDSHHHRPNTSSSTTTYIGIFVTSVDDNRLRLFVKDATTSHARFAPMTLLNDATSSPSNTQGVETHESSSAIDDPLVFSSPIMAVDSHITEEECRPSSSDAFATVKMNRLAMACYDGTVRILTYRMIIHRKQDDKDEDDAGSPHYQFCTRRCSRFLVDGPVASLQFGAASCPSREYSPVETPTLFLVAGSLCGFACVFYEALLPSADRFFDGPLLIFDGLDDGQRDGYVDSVTAVHVFSSIQTQQVIMVGTQSGRIVVLQQCDKERMAWNRAEAEVVCHRQERDELQYQFDEQTKQISLLEKEKERMEIKAHDLHTAIPVIPIESDDLSQSTAENVELTVVSIIGDGTNLDAESKDPSFEDESIDCIKDEAKIGRALSTDNAILDSPSQIELALLQQDIAIMESNISELSAGLVDIEKRRAECEEKAKRMRESLLHSINLRKLHHYEILRDYQFPYPIHGIVSGHVAEGNACNREIFVTTMRSFHVCLLNEITTLAEEKKAPTN